MRFLCWPLRCSLRVERSGSSFVRVSVAEKEETRRAELVRAIETAREKRAAIVIFPELSTAAGDVSFLRGILGRHAIGDHPILTIAGIEHCLAGETCVNEAVVLGPYGDELHRHQKLTRFTGAEGGEHIVTGTTVTVLESPIGNLCPLICLDLFNDAIEPVVTASHANVLLVPSLSNTTSAHRTAASEYLASNLATTVVCNRSIDGPDRHSFALLPGKSLLDGRTILQRIDENADYLLVVTQ